MKKITVVAIFIFLSGCSVLTLNGQPTVKVEDQHNVYRFRVFVNPYTKEKDIFNFAHKTAINLTTSNKCTSYELAQVLPSPESSDKGHIDFLAMLNCE